MRESDASEHLPFCVLDILEKGQSMVRVNIKERYICAKAYKDNLEM